MYSSSLAAVGHTWSQNVLAPPQTLLRLRSQPAGVGGGGTARQDSTKAQGGQEGEDSNPGSGGGGEAYTCITLGYTHSLAHILCLESARESAIASKIVFRPPPPQGMSSPNVLALLALLLSVVASWTPSRPSACHQHHAVWPHYRPHPPTTNTPHSYPLPSKAPAPPTCNAPQPVSPWPRHTHTYMPSSPPPPLSPPRPTHPPPAEHPPGPPPVWQPLPLVRQPLLEMRPGAAAAQLRAAAPRPPPGSSSSSTYIQIGGNSGSGKGTRTGRGRCARVRGSKWG